MPIITVESTGHIKGFAGSSVPLGYLACDGSLLLRSSYPALFAAISTTFNIGGESVDHFRLPDLRGKIRVGSGHDTGRGLTSRVGGAYLGVESHPLTITEIPGHTHTGTTNLSSDTHTHTGQSSGSVDLTHTHGYRANGLRCNGNNCSGYPQACGVTPQSGGSNQSLVHSHTANITSVSGTHNHTSYTTNTGVSVNSGAGNPHYNVMPSAVVNFCIKY